MMIKRRHSFRWYEYLAGVGVVLLTALFCVCAGSVPVPVSSTLAAIGSLLRGAPPPEGVAGAIIVSVRLPRVLCVALSGAALSLCGAAMQGLMRNPLADGSTMGVSSGASLGAVLAIAFGISVPGMPYVGTIAMAMVFAFGSLMLILTLSYALDRSLSSHTMILTGVVFTMFVTSLINLITVFAGEKVKSITFWTMGSLAGSSMLHAALLLGALTVGAAILLSHASELDAFAIGEEEARYIGVPVRRAKLTVLVAVSALIGVCVSIGGNIGFVGLVMPHMLRRATGPSHRRLLPASMLGGAVFLMLADLVGRTVISPIELPIGVITSLIGAVVFMAIFYRSGKEGAGKC